MIGCHGVVGCGWWRLVVRGRLDDPMFMGVYAFTFPCFQSLNLPQTSGIYTVLFEAFDGYLKPSKEQVGLAVWWLFCVLHV